MTRADISIEHLPSLATAIDEQQPVVFTNRKGHRLFGIFHKPRGARSDVGVVLLSPGIKMRVGPECLYRRMTDTFVRLGLPVLRFDFYGLGDSEGALTETDVRDVYNHIEVGRFVDDALDALDWMERTQGIKRVIVSGLCGGAVTGLLAGSRDARVAGLLALGITPVLASRAANPSQYMTLGQLQQMREGYLRKIWKPSAWLRLLTLQSDYRILWRSLVEPMRRKAAAKQGAAPVVPPDDNASPLFPPAFFNMLQAQRPMLLVFGGSDRLHWEFEEKFLARHQQRLASFASGFEVHVVPQANHVLSFQAWQDEMLDTASRWLHKHFKSALTSSEAAVRTELAPREAL